MSVSKQIVLKKGRDKPVRQQHPWVFSGAISSVEGPPENGDLVSVVTQNGEPLATAYYNVQSQIQGRILAWGDQPLPATFWREKIAAAAQRRALLPFNSEAYRVVNAEADGLPGLVIDRYGDYLVMQCLTLGIDKRKEMLVEIVADLFAPVGIIERSDVSVRRKEGLKQTKGLLWGDAPPEILIIEENGIKYEVNLLLGHKTGLYLDQRENRPITCAPHHVADKDVLNLFSYTGGFGLHAARNGARSTINVDSSARILEHAERNMQLNGLDGDNHEYVAADVFELLRHYRDTDRKFDLIVLDPPKFVHSQRDMRKATRAYKDLNWLALRLLRPNGVLSTFSCSGLVSAELFQKVIFGALIDAKREAQIMQTLTQSPDHATLLTFPESAYLKGLLCRVW